MLLRKDFRHSRYEHVTRIRPRNNQFKRKFDCKLTTTEISERNFIKDKKKALFLLCEN